MAAEKLDRIKELTELLGRASRAYYAEDRELMSNYEYDRLYDELAQLEQETGIVLAGSPTRHVGYEAVDELPKEAHEAPMLSLDKTKDREELRSWLQGQPAVLSWKLDGLTGKGGNPGQRRGGRGHNGQCQDLYKPAAKYRFSGGTGASGGGGDQLSGF